MSWSKLIGGVIGAAVGGPVGAGLGVLLGGGLEASDATQKSSGIPNGADGGQLALTMAGNVLTVTATVPSDLDVDAIQVRLKQGEAFLSSSVDYYQDDKGDFRLLRDLHANPMSLDIPLDVVSIPVGEIFALRVVVVFFLNEKYVGHLITPGQVRLAAVPWSDVRWLSPIVDLLAHFALRHGPWSAPKVKLIKEVIGEFVELDVHESKILRDRLLLAARPSTQDCIEVFLRRFDNAELFRGLFKGVLGLLQLSGRSQNEIASELNRLGEEFQLPPQYVQHFLGKFAGAAPPSSDSDNDEVRWACKVLEVEPGASQDTIKQAWRNKVSELHPDKYSNLPASVQDLIKQKAQELNRARELLRG